MARESEDICLTNAYFYDFLLAARWFFDKSLHFPTIPK